MISWSVHVMSLLNCVRVGSAGPPSRLKEHSFNVVGRWFSKALIVFVFPSGCSERERGPDTVFDLLLWKNSNYFLLRISFCASESNFVLLTSTAIGWIKSQMWILNSRFKNKKTKTKLQFQLCSVFIFQSVVSSCCGGARRVLKLDFSPLMSHLTLPWWLCVIVYLVC